MTSVHPELPPMHRGPRVERLRESLGGSGADALVVTKAVNIRWLTGFTGSNATLLVTGHELLFVTDGRYRGQAADELARAGVDATIEIASSPGAVLGSAGRRLGLDSVALEADDVAWATATVATDEWFPEAAVVASHGMVEALREVKEPAEVARAEAAAAIADRALAQVVAMLADAPTEVEVAVELEAALRRGGAEEPAFPTIVASGPNGALPHHHPDHRRIERGDLVVIDMGATVDGYRSDMTRTIAVGELREAQQRQLDVVGAAQAAGLGTVAAGVAARDVDAAARSVIAEAGWADAFVHPTGHGVGLEIHEPLRLAPTSDATLAAGHIVTVEPGVYLPGVGGVRIEDMVEVTEDGCRPLTRSPHTLAVG